MQSLPQGQRHSKSYSLVTMVASSFMSLGMACSKCLIHPSLGAGRLWQQSWNAFMLQISSHMNLWDRNVDNLQLKAEEKRVLIYHQRIPEIVLGGTNKVIPKKMVHNRSGCGTSLKYTVSIQKNGY